MWNARLDETQAGIKIAGRNINNLRYADNTTLIAEIEEELKSPQRKVKKLAENSVVKKLRSWHPFPSLHDKQMGKHQKQWKTLFSWAPKSLQVVAAAMKVNNAYSLE